VENAPGRPQNKDVVSQGDRGQGERDLRIVPMPELRKEKRRKRDGHQQQYKRYYHPGMRLCCGLLHRRTLSSDSGGSMKFVVSSQTHRFPSATTSFVTNLMRAKHSGICESQMPWRVQTHPPESFAGGASLYWLKREKSILQTSPFFGGRDRLSAFASNSIPFQGNANSTDQPRS